MDRISKEKMEFVKEQINKMAAQFQPLEIFCRENNPYLRYKDNFFTTKKYKELKNKKEWWENHILGLLSLRKTYL